MSVTKTMDRLYHFHLEIGASLGYYVLGVFVAIVTGDLQIPIGVKLGLLSFGAVLGSGYFIFRALHTDGTKDFPARVFEVFANSIVAIVVGALLIEFLNYRYGLTASANNGTLSIDAVLFLYVGVAFGIVAMGQAGIKWFVGVIKDIILNRVKK